MKQFLQILIFLCVATVANAQSNMEAKMAYQMAEEKFDAKQYDEALEYLKKAETALGSTNPPMLFLKVMITNQIVTANESTDNYQKLEKAIADFDKHKDKEALGEDKLMDVYRIKMDLDKRKTAYEKEASRTASLKKQYDEMVYRLASEFPKTEITVKDLIGSIPSTWQEPRWTESVSKFTEQRINKLIEWGGGNFSYIRVREENKLYLSHFKTDAPGVDRIKDYSIQKAFKCYNKFKDNVSRPVTVKEICEVLDITSQQWTDFTTGADPLISTTEKERYRITLTNKKQQKLDNGYPNFEMVIFKNTRGSLCEEIWMIVFENTL